MRRSCNSSGKTQPGPLNWKEKQLLGEAIMAAIISELSPREERWELLLWVWLEVKVPERSVSMRD